MLNYRKNIDNEKNLLNYSVCKKLIYEQNFEHIDSGTQSEVYKAHSDKCGSIVIKRAGKKEYDENYNNYMLKKLITENKILLKIKKLIIENICPNFIEVIDFIPEKKCLILEYADGNVSKIIQNKINFELLLSFILQILFGFYCLNKNLKIYHNDSNLGNMLYKKINDDIIFCYELNGKKYYVPTFGFLFMISDFGRTVEISYIKKQKMDINKYNDLRIFYFEIVKNIVKSVSKKHNKNFDDYKNIFNFKNKKIIEDLLIEGLTIREIINNTHTFEKMSLPIFNMEEMIKNDFTKDTIELLNMIDDNSDIENIIKKIYDKFLDKNNHKLDKIAMFKIDT
jgi:hypothetical protein